MQVSSVFTIMKDIAETGDIRNAAVVMLNGAAIGQRFDLSRGSWTFGRGIQSDIQLKHESVSRKHARLIVGESSLSVEDLGSTNGTYVDGVNIRACEIRDGQCLKIGRSVMRVIFSDKMDARYHSEICWLGKYDGLTQCLHKRGFIADFERELSRALRYERDLSLITIDIDGLRDINERHGNLVGDAVIVEVARAFECRARRDDFIGRLEGGLFTILTPEICLSKADHVARQLCAIANSLSIPVEGSQVSPYLKYGVSSLSDIARTPQLSDNEVFGDTYAAEPTLLRSPGTKSQSTEEALNLTTRPGEARPDGISELASTLLSLAQRRMRSRKT